MERKKIKVVESNSLERCYPHNVSMYRLLPTEEVSYEEFKELITERLTLLRILDNATLKHSRILSPQWKESVLTELNKENLKYFVRLIQGSQKETIVQARRRDYLSHFILRLAYCRSEELRKWFVARELEYFRYKFSNLTASELKSFLAQNQFNYIPLNEGEKSTIKDGLYSSSAGLSASNVEVTDFYKVHFTIVPSLIKGRRCFVKGGFAYVSSNDFDSVISTELTKVIEEGLDYAFKILPAVEEDDRIYGLIKNLHTTYIGKDYSIADGSKISIEHLELLSKKFPLCMRVLHEGLKASHHMKHGGRMQYGLFLKGIGVTLEDSLRFWKQEFTKMMDLEKFEKTYAYNIRHNYGKEGSMVNYTPHSCMKIISGSVGPQENHGCPFKQWDVSVLKQKLAEYGVGKAHVQEIASFASKGHYQLACSRYFECAHGVKNDVGITHPNQYFEQSQQLIKERSNEGMKKEQPDLRKGKAERLNASLSTQSQSQTQSLLDIEDDLDETLVAMADSQAY